ncbi:DUF2848 domain-containing protein [Neobacillus niacini]|uniref:DUF2848 domain-containing protein n=1 Tax=Neobacillus niacini TaxID=86668 RepID=UPI0021CB88FA|nr:DUF2848 domain-containing protein [Neobacillus niacini]MCM3766362.1 DUF2848 domain-containing protein [Neobacillus niacini]
MKFLVNGKEVNWEPKNLLIAGYTSKDQNSLREHIEELEKIGVPAPPTVPMIYQLSPELLSTDAEITAVRNDSSGEAEVVILNIEGEWYVGLGSDHTDRVLEAVSIQKSKQVCAKPVTTKLWPLCSIEDHWDEIEMNSWYVVNGKEILYQSGKLAEFLTPTELVEIIEARGYSVSEAAILCGTLPILSNEFLYGEEFKAELYDPKSNERISLSYQIKILKDAEVV